MGVYFKKYVENCVHLKEVLLFSSLTLVKMVIFHYLMDLQSGILLITFNNFILILAIYFLVDLCSSKNRLRNLLIAHFLISVLFFVEKIYFSHFFTLIPIHSVYQMGQLGGVSESIMTLIRPVYFLFFMDFIALIFYYKQNPVKVKLQKKQRLAFFLVVISLILVTSLVSSSIVRSSGGMHTPYNLGVMSYHFFDIYNFVAGNNTADEQDVHEYIDEYINRTDLVHKDTFGLAKDKNIIVLQMESIHNFVIDLKVNGQYVTPVLNDLVLNDSFYFNNYFEQVSTGNTSDAEFISNNSFYPSSNVQTYSRYEENEFTAFPSLLKEQKGYSTFIFHGFEAEFWNRENFYTTQGIDHFVSMEDLEQDEIIGMGISDGSVFRQSMDYLVDTDKPFYAKYVTLTSHTPFRMEEDFKFLDLPEAYQDTLVGDYLQTVKYLDKMIGQFIENLKKHNLYEDSIIILYGDHKGLRVEEEETNELVSKLLGEPFKEGEMYKVPLIAHIPGSNVDETIETVGGMVDFYPTFANLVGLDLDGVPMLGRNLFNAKEGFSVIKNPLGRGSFVDDEKIFLMSSDGVFENSTAWDRVTREPVSLDDCKEGYKRALRHLKLSEYILDNNLITSSSN
ncbi:LTA synthase family protein [Proteinivorax hydrogeniformans]|uniref:LTA synthase family protein n=1 Tax=Proteinivorax hydrogeniformans TaxID=1826727 RepID=A0AAU8HVU6_9FIRM